MREFDDIIRRKLEQLPVEGTPDWSSLQTRLEGDTFDSLLRNQLSSTTNTSGADKVALAATGWEALSNKLDLATEIEGEVFDRILSQKLANVETPLEPQASWKVLSHRMDTLWPLRKVLVRYRVLELAAAIALLLTFAPLLRDNPISVGGTFGSTTAAVPDTYQALPQKSTLLETGSTTPFLKPDEIAALVYATSSQDPQKLNAGQISLETQSATASSSSTAQEYSPFSLLKGVFEWFRFSASSSETHGFVQRDETQRPLHSSELTVLSSWTTSSIFGDNQPTAEKLSADALSPLALQPLTIEEINVPSIALPTPQASKWEVGAQAGVQAWNIRTPVDIEFEQQPNARWRGGSTLGLSANRALGKRTALGLGASFSSLTYDPNLPTVFNPADISRGSLLDLTESFDGISVNIGQVPVDFRVRLTKPEKRFHVWASAGVASNFILSSSYDRKLEVGVPELISSPVSETEEFIEVERTYAEAKDFSPGLLEPNGGLKGNTFFTVRMGLDASYKLTERINVFSSLTYNHYVPITAGIGPNNDRLSAVGLSLGARVSL